MTTPHTNTLGHPELGERFRPLGREIKALLVLGIPMALTQLVQFSVQTIDILMIGQLGAEALAAAALANVLFFIPFTVGFGPVMAVSPIVSQALGANRQNFEHVRVTIRMGLWLIILMFPPMLVYFLLAPDLARALGQPENLASLAGPYILALGPGMPFMMGVFMLRNFLAAIDRTRVPLYASLIATLVNVLFNYLLIYGNFGFPRLELVGAGIASAIAHASGFAFLLVYIYADKEARQFRILKDAFVFRWRRLREIIRLGAAMGATFALEATFFNSGVFLMGLIGTNEVAAYQVALNVAALAFMLPLGFSMAGGVRVGLAVGARNPEGIQHAAIATFIVCGSAILLFAIPVSIWPESVAALYLKAEGGDNLEVLALVALFLPVAAAFMLFDALQVAANQVLRGLKDVNIPVILVAISFWVIGFPVALYLGLRTSVGALGIWYGFLISLAIVSLLLGIRVYQLLRPSRNAYWANRPPDTD